MIKELVILEKEYNDYKVAYNELLKKNNSLVKNSKYSKGFILNIRDFEKESMGFKKGKEFKSLPKNLKDVYVYHFNNNNEIIMIDTYGSSPNIIDKEFCIHNKEGLKTYYYNGGATRLRNVTFSKVQNGKTIQVFSYGGVGSSIKNYFFNSNSELIEKIVVQSKQHNKDEFENSELLFKFNDKKELTKIIQAYSNGFEKDIYKG